MSKKIKEVHKVINKLRKEKSRINMTSKRLLRRQVLVFISLSNLMKFMVLFCKHVVNINRALKDIKSDIMADFIWADHWDLTITIASSSDLSTIEKYIKNIDSIDLDDIMMSRLPQLKSYLKILGILYLIEDTNVPISSDVVKRITKSTHIFNDVVLAFKLRVIKALPKLDIVIIWVDI